MDNDHGITGELREWAEDALMWLSAHEDLIAIADRIDAEHEAKVSYWQSASYKDGYDEGFASADDWLGQHEDAMAEHGWIRLPLDANGEVVRIGDEVDSDHHEDGTVTGVQFYEMANGGIRTLVAVRPDGWDVATWHTPDEYRHHKQPTVEDVLREFAQRWNDPTHYAKGELVEQYAARLQLREEA